MKGEEGERERGVERNIEERKRGYMEIRTGKEKRGRKRRKREEGKIEKRERETKEVRIN